MTETRRVFYIGHLQLGSTALHRKTALEQLGFAVTPFDTHPHLSEGTRVARSARHRLAWGPVISRLNREVVAAGSDVDVDWIWVDKGVWIWPETLTTLGALGRQLVHYTPDAMILINRTRHFLRSIPLYDLLITPKRYELDLYRQQGARRIALLLHGYDQQLFRPLPTGAKAELDRFSSDVCFVGRTERHYVRRIRTVSETDVQLAVWGPTWQRAAARRPWLRQVVRGPGVWDEEYVRALNATKIGLGLLSRLARDESTTRTFEIPACGTFLLAERSPEHIELFEEGKEAEFFDSDKELREKITWYLEHDDERRRVAAAGREKCVKAGYSYLDRLRSVVGLMD